MTTTEMPMVAAEDLATVRRQLAELERVTVRALQQEAAEFHVGAVLSGDFSAFGARGPGSRADRRLREARERVDALRWSLPALEAAAREERAAAAVPTPPSPEALRKIEADFSRMKVHHDRASVRAGFLSPSVLEGPPAPAPVAVAADRDPEVARDEAVFTELSKRELRRAGLA